MKIIWEEEKLITFLRGRLVESYIFTNSMGGSKYYERTKKYYKVGIITGESARTEKVEIIDL